MSHTHRNVTDVRNAGPQSHVFVSTGSKYTGSIYYLPICDGPIIRHTMMYPSQTLKKIQKIFHITSPFLHL